LFGFGLVLGVVGELEGPGPIPGPASEKEKEGAEWEAEGKEGEAEVSALTLRTFNQVTTSWNWTFSLSAQISRRGMGGLGVSASKISREDWIEGVRDGNTVGGGWLIFGGEVRERQKEDSHIISLPIFLTPLAPLAAPSLSFILRCTVR